MNITAEIGARRKPLVRSADKWTLQASRHLAEVHAELLCQCCAYQRPTLEGAGRGSSMFDRLDKRRIVVASAGPVHARRDDPFPQDVIGRRA